MARWVFFSRLWKDWCCALLVLWVCMILACMLRVIRIRGSFSWWCWIVTICSRFCFLVNKVSEYSFFEEQIQILRSEGHPSCLQFSTALFYWIHGVTWHCRFPQFRFLMNVIYIAKPKPINRFLWVVQILWKSVLCSIALWLRADRRIDKEEPNNSPLLLMCIVLKKWFHLS